MPPRRSRSQPGGARARSRGGGPPVEDRDPAWEAAGALHVLPVVFCASPEPRGPDRDLEPREYARTCLLLQDERECGSLRLPDPDIVSHADRGAPLPLRELAILNLPERATDAVRLAASSPNNRCSAFLLRSNSIILRQDRLYLLPPLGAAGGAGSAALDLPEPRLLEKVDRTNRLPSGFAMRGRGYEQYPLERGSGVRVAAMAVGDQGDLVAIADDGTVYIRDHLLGLGPAGAAGAGGPGSPFYAAFHVFPELADDDDIFQNPEEGGTFAYSYAAAVPPVGSDITDLDSEIVVCRAGVNNKYVRVDRVVFLGPRGGGGAPGAGPDGGRFEPFALRPVLLELGSYDDKRSIACSLGPLGTVLAVVYNGVLACLPVRLRYCRGCDADPGNPCDYCRRKRAAGEAEGRDMFATTQGVFRSGGGGRGLRGTLGSPSGGGARGRYLDESSVFGDSQQGSLADSLADSLGGSLPNSQADLQADSLANSLADSLARPPAGSRSTPSLGRKARQPARNIASSVAISPGTPARGADGLRLSSAGAGAGYGEYDEYGVEDQDFGRGSSGPGGVASTVGSTAAGTTRGPAATVAHLLEPGRSLDYGLQKSPGRSALGRARVLHGICHYVPQAAVDRCSVTTTNVAELVATFLGAHGSSARRAQRRLEVSDIIWSQDNAVLALLFPDMVLFCTAFGSPLDVRLHALGLVPRVPGHESHDCALAGASSCQSVGPLLTFATPASGNLVGQFLGGRDVLIKANRGVRVFRLELGYNRNAGAAGVLGGAGGIIVYPERWWNRAGAIAMVQGVRETPIPSPVQYYRDLSRMLVYSTTYVQEFMWATMLCTARSQLAAVSAQSVQGLGADTSLVMESDLASTYLILLTELNSRVQGLLEQKLRRLLEKMSPDEARAREKDAGESAGPLPRRPVEADYFTDVYEVCCIPYLLVSARLSVTVTLLLLHCAGGLYTTIVNSIMEVIDPDSKPGEKSVTGYFYDCLLAVLSFLADRAEPQAQASFAAGAMTPRQRALAGRSARDVLGVAMLFAELAGALGRFYLRVDCTCRNYRLPPFAAYNVALGFACLASDVAAASGPQGGGWGPGSAGGPAAGRAEGPDRSGEVASALARKLAQRLGFGGLQDYIARTSSSQPGWTGAPEDAVSSPRPCPYLAVYLLHQFHAGLDVHPGPGLARKPAGRPMTRSDISLLLRRTYGEFVTVLDRPADDFYVECVGALLRGEDVVFADVVLRERARGRGGAAGEAREAEEGEVPTDGLRAVRAGLTGLAGSAGAGGSSGEDPAGGAPLDDARSDPDAVVYVLNQLLALGDLQGALSLVFCNAATDAATDAAANGAGAGAGGAPAPAGRSCRRDAERLCERLSGLAGAVPDSWVPACRALVGRMSEPVAEWLLQLCTACMTGLGVFPRALLPPGDRTLLEPRRAYVRDVALGEYFHLLVASLPASDALLLSPYMAAALCTGLGRPGRALAALLGNRCARMAGCLAPVLVGAFPGDRRLRRLAQAIEQDPGVLDRIDAQPGRGPTGNWLADARGPPGANEAGVGSSGAGPSADRGAGAAGPGGAAFDVRESGLTDVSVGWPGPGAKNSGIAEDILDEMREAQFPGGSGAGGGAPGFQASLASAPDYGAAAQPAPSFFPRPASKMVVPTFKLQRRAPQPGEAPGAAPGAGAAPAAQNAPSAHTAPAAPGGAGVPGAPGPYGGPGGYAGYGPGGYGGGYGGQGAYGQYGAPPAPGGHPPAPTVPGALDNPYDGRPLLGVRGYPGAEAQPISLFAGGWGVQPPRVPPPLVPALGAGPPGPAESVPVDAGQLPFRGIFNQPEPEAPASVGLPPAEARPFASGRPLGQPYYAVPPGTRLAGSGVGISETDLPAGMRAGGGPVGVVGPAGIVGPSGDAFPARVAYHDELRAGAARGHRNPMYPASVRGGDAQGPAPGPPVLARFFESQGAPGAPGAGERRRSRRSGAPDNPPPESTAPGPAAFAEAGPGDELFPQQRQGWRYLRGDFPDDGPARPPAPSGRAWPVLPFDPARAKPGAAPEERRPPYGEDGGAEIPPLVPKGGRAPQFPQRYSSPGHYDYVWLRDERDRRLSKHPAAESYNGGRLRGPTAAPLPPWEEMPAPAPGTRADYHSRVPFAQPVGRPELDGAKRALGLPIHGPAPAAGGGPGAYSSVTGSSLPPVSSLSSVTSVSTSASGLPSSSNLAGERGDLGRHRHHHSRSRRDGPLPGPPPGPPPDPAEADAPGPFPGPPPRDAPPSSSLGGARALRAHQPAPAPSPMRGDGERDRRSFTSWTAQASRNAEQGLLAAGGEGPGAPAGPMNPDQAEEMF